MQTPGVSETLQTDFVCLLYPALPIPLGTSAQFHSWSGLPCLKATYKNTAEVNPPDILQ